MQDEQARWKWEEANSQYKGGRWDYIATQCEKYVYQRKLECQHK